MENKKKFDCVAMKNKAQEKLRKDFAGLTDDEERLRIQAELMKSDDLVARKWRELKKRAARAA